ncbi:hypothetical protein BC938DRAFT_476880 [Jimgerdemannia flammicorona]|uniref:Rho-GAP domain-containing protein n=1 Tax=Jimgerdemannia flammicorona TaxID=994334 RepID=A0A433PDE6_9FUNG|nr:hypothetical protein BC938DRAFT_476880 [Jimgerdemannia flammicorona]
MYMRELPESIVPDPLAAEFATLVSTLGQSLPTSPSSLPQQPILSPSFIASAALLTHRLPPANFHLLKALCAHLARIDANSLINKMNISNLGVIFCPTLGVSSVLFRCFVTENTAVFGNGPPVILDNLGCAITTSDDLARSKSPSVGIVGGKVAAISAVANARNHTQVSESSAKSLPSSFRGRGNSIGASPFHRFEDQDPVVATSPASLSAPKRTPVSARSSPTKGYFNTDHTSGSGSQLVSSTSTSSSSTNTTSSSSSVSASSGSLSSHASVGSLTSPNLPSSTANPTTTSTTNGLLAIDLIDKQTGSRNLAVLNVALREDQDRVRRARPRGMSASEEPDRWRREMIREREARAKAKEEAGVTTGMSGPVRSLARARAASAAAAGTMTTGA